MYGKKCFFLVVKYFGCFALVASLLRTIVPLRRSKIYSYLLGRPNKLQGKKCLLRNKVIFECLEFVTTLRKFKTNNL